MNPLNALFSLASHILPIKRSPYELAGPDDPVLTEDEAREILSGEGDRNCDFILPYSVREGAPLAGLAKPQLTHSELGQLRRALWLYQENWNGPNDTFAHDCAQHLFDLEESLGVVVMSYYRFLEFFNPYDRYHAPPPPASKPVSKGDFTSFHQEILQTKEHPIPTDLEKPVQQFWNDFWTWGSQHGAFMSRGYLDGCLHSQWVAFVRQPN